MKIPNLKIKVCGMRDEENIRQIVALRPDYIGFILYPGSKRYVGDDFSLTISIPDVVQKTGVFVNELIPEVFRWINRLNLDLIQLHGEESPEYCTELSNMDVKVIKAFGIDEKFDFSSLEAYESCCDYFLFDTKSDLYGGTGKQFNWNLLEDYNYDIPLFLSGGIGPDDDEIIQHHSRIANIHGIDINSRFEISPGIKNPAALKAFFHKLRSN
ncbi:MAG: phosphoribosylanthranilate isomerase [Bacteroidales bacterium]|jgi:phosphoribosylanthranilate isomerase